MEDSATRVLVVDDHEGWRAFLSNTLQKQTKFRLLGEALDGLQAVRKATELQPDLVLMDIGIPILNGIEAARQIREASPLSKILFVTENRSPDVVAEALRTGAAGYVVKSDAARELLPALQALLQGKKFVSPSLAVGDASAHIDKHDSTLTVGELLEPVAPNIETPGCHEVGFYYDDRHLVDDLTQFIGSALNAGNAAIVVATEPHRNALLARLQTDGLDMRAAIEQGRYIALDAASVLLTFMHAGTLDPERFMKAFGRLMLTAAKAAKGPRPRVSLFGEAVDLLLAEASANAAIQDEKLCNELIKTHDVHIRCAYSVGGVRTPMDRHLFQQICAEHSAVYSQ